MFGKILILLALPMTACHFVVAALPQGGSGDLGPSVEPDGGADDLTPVVAADLAGSPPGAPDLADPGPTPPVDPCTVPPGAPTNAEVARCVIDSPPAIDGNLADWPAALFTARLQHRSADGALGNWSGNEDNNDANLSARVATRWDRDHLYIAVQFTDDSSYTPTTAYDQGDSIEITFDALRDQLASTSTDGTRLILIRSGAGDAYTLSAPTTAQPMPAGVIAKVAASGTGFALELAIPWTTLGTAPAMPGRFLGFDVSVNDADGSDSTRERSLLWKNTAPPGCLCANGSACAPWCSTKALWTLTLGGR